MNLSGLRQMRGHWGDVIAGLRYLRGLYPHSTPNIRYIDLWRLCSLGELLPAFLLYRSHEPVPNGQLPSHVAGMYKIAIGLVHAAQLLAFTTFFRGAEKIAEPLQYDDLLSFVEENNLFIGPTEVCAGPEPLIREVVNVLKDKPCSLDSTQKDKLLIGDEEAFLEFCYCRMNSTVLAYIHSIIAESLYSRIRKTAWPGSQSGMAISEADPQLAILASLDKTTAKAVLNGIVEVAVSDYPGDAGLRETARQIPDLFNDVKPSSKIVDLLGKHGQIAGMAENISRYLQLERITFELSRTLKQQCLEALGLKGSLHLNAVASKFFPPDSKMRSLLGTMFGIQILPNLQVQSKGRIVMSLIEELPWS